MSSRRTTRKQREHWLAQFDQSNLTAAAFCREHQLSYQSFLNWRRKAQTNETDAPTEFIELEIPSPRATPIRHSSVVELTFPGGLLLRIHPQSTTRS
ncbi:MAG: transposase [Akkermansiaceae bacterium]|nr:transposase [Akkermansiaceae bacterium]